MRLKLLPKLMLFILIPVFSILAGLSWLNYTKAEQTLRAQIDADMRIILEQQVREYVSFYRDISRIAEGFAQQQEVALAFASPGTEGAEQAAATLLKRYPHIGLLALVRPDGTVLLREGAAKNFAAEASTAFLGQPQDGREKHAVLNSKNPREMLFIISVPVVQSTVKVGTVALAIPLESLAAMYSDRIRVGSTGKCFVLDASGVVLMDPTDKGSIGMNISNIPWIQTILGNAQGLVRYVWSGTDKTCYYERIAGLNWTVALGITDDDLLAPVKAMRDNTLLMSGLALLLLAGIVFVIAQRIAVPLRSAASFVAEVGTGNMQISPELIAEQQKLCTRSDEIGGLAQGIGNMYQNLKKTLAASEENAQSANTAAAEAKAAMQQAEAALHKAENARHEGVLAVTSQLEGIANTLSASAMELSTHIEQSGRGSAEQVKRVGQTVEAMEEMNATVLEVAQNASAASGFSADTRKKAEGGAVVVSQVVDSIKTVQTQSLALKDDMATLGGYANAISQIMGVISDIADQTNLLALNAAIEAARAGDAGRGFAVVADEVRKLAEKTVVSTTDVGNAIRAIQQSVQQNITQVDEAVHNIADAADLASQSGASLEEIVDMVDSTADQVRAIASAAEEQSASSEEINQSMASVNAIAQETATSMGEASLAVTNLAAQARQLNDIIAEMKKG